MNYKANFDTLTEIEETYLSAEKAKVALDKFINDAFEGCNGSTFEYYKKTLRVQAEIAFDYVVDVLTRLTNIEDNYHRIEEESNEGINKN